MSIHNVVEGTLYQSASEKLVYKITTTNWASDPTVTDDSIVVIDEYTGEDVTDTVFPINEPSVGTGDNSDVISTSLLGGLVEGHRYRVEVPFVVGSNEWELRFFVECLF